MPSILSVIKHTGPEGTHNSNVTACQSVTPCMLYTGEVSRTRSELVQKPNQSHKKVFNLNVLLIKIRRSQMH